MNKIEAKHSQQELVTQVEQKYAPEKLDAMREIKCSRSQRVNTLKDETADTQNPHTKPDKVKLENSRVKPRTALAVCADTIRRDKCADTIQVNNWWNERKRELNKYYWVSDPRVSEPIPLFKMISFEKGWIILFLLLAFIFLMIKLNF